MPGWSDLPLLLMDKITRQLGTHDLVQLRPICKSWKAACTEFGGSAVGYIRDQKEMLDICAILPNISTLTLINTAADFDLSPLAACSKLVDVALHHDFLTRLEGQAPPLDFGCLPLGLHTLNVSFFDLYASGMLTTGTSTGGSFASLTSLKLKWRPCDRDILPAMWKLLVDMPNLKVYCPLYALLLCPSFSLGQRTEKFDSMLWC